MMDKEYSRHISYLAGFVIFLMVPVFFCYQALVQAEVFYPFLRGFYTYAMIFTFPAALYVFCVVCGAKVFLAARSAWLFWLFMIFFFCLSLYSVFSYVNKEISSYIVLSFFRYLFMFLFAFSFAVAAKNFGSGLVAFVLGYSTWIFLSSFGEPFVRPAFYYGSYLFEFDYQQVAFSYLAVSVFLLPGMSVRLRILYYIAVFPALYLLGARSEFFAFFLLFLVLECIYARWFLVLILALASLSLVILAALDDLSFLKGFRMFSIFFEDADMSYDAREIFAMRSFETLNSHPVLGAFGSNAPGEYAHNLFAVWVDMGLVGFITFIAMLLVPLFSLCAFYHARAGESGWVRAFLFLVITIFLVLVAKTYTYGLVPIALAAYCLFKLNRVESASSKVRW